MLSKAMPTRVMTTCRGEHERPLARMPRRMADRFVVWRWVSLGECHHCWEQWAFTRLCLATVSSDRSNNNSGVNKASRRCGALPERN